ncbi:Tetratricopeptide repeat-containing protein [Paracoccus homiensis]|uniref:Tetratricopeptide repeat-containing protein n=1 Tax=Paracoccus homiensis TaxID=364199 RepID=A0A1I0ELG7_9RHOB|nr:Tetratricopeptide repeat-containing protein [Paracoccus homiensis]
MSRLGRNALVISAMDDVSTTRPNLALIVALLAGLSLPAVAQEPPAPKPDQSPSAATAKAGDDQTAPLTFGLAGPYLAARMATVENDYRAAARYFVQAVAHDRGDRYLQDNALVALVSAGNIPRAVELAQQMTQDGDRTELSDILLRAQLAHQGDWTGLIQLIDTARSDDDSQRNLIEDMVQAWALMGAGRASDALAEFERLSQIDGVGPMVRYHLALARGMVGDYESAQELLADPATGGHLLGVTARAQILSQLEQNDKAVDMLNQLQGIEAEPQIVALRDRLETGETIPFDVVKSPADGISQAFLTFATALASNPDPEPLSLIHARIAAWLSPEMPEARLMVAQLLQDRQQFDLAEPEFEALRQMGQMRPVAELSRIDALSRADRRAEAEKAALALTAAYPDLPQAWVALGDVLRQQEKFAQAVPAYDKSLALMQDGPDQSRWFPLYARGIALERSGQFDRAEADLQAAIKIKPDQASLLNYLGYSWIDRNQHLEKGLELIQKAVELSPNDGYILDSLAWAYFRLGRFDEAVAPMEQAVGSMAADPVVNDHLGDIYWMVGRTREAEIQWQRALSLEPGDSGDVDPDRLRAKLDRGLDAVMAEERAAGETKDLPPPQTEAGARTDPKTTD